MTRTQLLVATSTLLAPASALAQDPSDFGRIADAIRFGGVLLSIPIIIATLIALRLVETAAERLSHRFTDRRPTILKLQSVVRFVLYVVALVITSSLSVRLDATTLTIIGGGLAVAVGFAMRDLVAAFIAGVTIIFDRPFQVGDRVAYAGEYGDIISIGLRSVRMNTLDHNVVTIPNNKVLTDVVASSNYGALEMQVAIDFFIGVDQDARLAAELIRDACLASPYVYLRNPVPVLAKQEVLGSYVAIHLKARPYVFDCKYEKAFETDVHFRVLDAFRERGVLPPALLHRELPPEVAGRRA